ncbi:hypothetical protein RHEC894_CH03899 [Rhizobium sp. CIAT894]|uniref:DUF2950 family protein n=1 Tax=Rhizobium sp. CIAT894 TaxID=2020312 RepID=UPI000A1F594F|nr:DUF2950 family protein [Rhizobium sp. CIAT894]ARM90152.1 hypothetical protein RHEC894_CH03899 [Rhizobium sp. CIAT894]
MTRQSRLISLMLGAAVFWTAPQLSVAQEQSNLEEFAAGTPPTFDSPSLAVDQFKQVLASGEVDGLANLLGLSAAKLKASNEAMVAYALIREGAGKQVVLQDLGDRKVVAIGDHLWPLPFPLSRDQNGKWAFDRKTGLQEIVNRRVGRNELATIQTMTDYFVAQYEYAREDRDGDGVYEFAQKLVSTKGARDGLYWEPGAYEEESPAGGLVESAAFGNAKRGEGYYGYRYRILTAQGSNVVGGKQSYIVNGNMTGGFALIAWPVSYRVTGVQTFMVNNMGVIYQRDLGDQTERLASAIKEFNPGADWSLVED